MKSTGYLISTISVVLLGIVAWPKPADPPWKAVILIAGILASLLGLLLRYLAYQKEQAAENAVQKYSVGELDASTVKADNLSGN